MGVGVGVGVGEVKWQIQYGGALAYLYILLYLG